MPSLLQAAQAPIFATEIIEIINILIKLLIHYKKILALYLQRFFATALVFFTSELLFPGNQLGNKRINKTNVQR